MTVIVAGSLHFPSGTREQALAETVGLIEQTRTDLQARLWLAVQTGRPELKAAMERVGRG